MLGFALYHIDALTLLLNCCEILRSTFNIQLLKEYQLPKLQKAREPC